MDDKLNLKWMIIAVVALSAFWAIVFHLSEPYIEANRLKHEAREAVNLEWIGAHQCVQVESKRPMHNGKFIVERDGYMCDDKIVHYECITCNHQPKEEDQCSCSE